MEGYITVSEYAKIHSKDAGNVRRMLIQGRIHGAKLGRQWAIKKDTPYPEDRRIVSGDYKNYRQKLRINSDKTLSAVLKELTENLKHIYGDMLTEIILYGSYARGTQTDESDVDIAVFLNDKPARTLTDEVIKCVSACEMKCDRVLSVVDVDCKKFELWCNDLPFYKNIKKEGIVLWKTAT